MTYKYEPYYDLAAEMLLHVLDLESGAEQGQSVDEYLRSIRQHPVVVAMREAASDGHQRLKEQRQP